MITRSTGSVLHAHAIQILSSAKQSCHSWFLQIRQLCLMYELPNPILLLENPLPPTSFNKLMKSKIVDYWEQKLRAEASQLTSAPFFRPSFMCLTKPHPIWYSCGSNPFECHKAVIAAMMVSGRYLTDRLQRPWSTNNKEGLCLLPTCCLSQASGTLEH